MKKIGILELLVVVSIVATTVAIGYNFLTPTSQRYVFDGEEMYKCAWVSETILTKGFPLYANIEGRYTLDGLEFSDTVQILSAKGGTITALYNDREITIGGKLASSENIAANKIYLRPLGNTLLRYNIESITGTSFSDISKKISLDQNEVTVLAIILDGTFAVDSKSFTPTEQLKIMNYFKSETNSPKINFVDGGLILKGRLNLNDLKNLDDIIDVEKIVTSNLTVSIILNETKSEINMSNYENAKVATWM
ncbi:conserved hypothetical protein [Methanococcus vannielii SB]|jgi:hypothetical protein|uniref:Transcription regulator TrmB C-terminal domain-containing protein n=1 Tax=Methanococcus vannielii (strain ATCC 35089 / DSM 1224 / JCM 13029 / OCM 148 / SB) TaxID=406327 RepID=A6UPC2_METVS|nr:TrmB family transcriptional regulator sugar-binding domain-containing protein [Methanococcus vannielii]ABR54344.1 conserved hypothetical protein [Methanococcus vannielii SB]